MRAQDSSRARLNTGIAQVRGHEPSSPASSATPLKFDDGQAVRARPSRPHPSPDLDAIDNLDRSIHAVPVIPFVAVVGGPDALQADVVDSPQIGVLPTGVTQSHPPGDSPTPVVSPIALPHPSSHKPPKASPSKNLSRSDGHGVSRADTGGIGVRLGSAALTRRAASQLDLHSDTKPSPARSALEAADSPRSSRYAASMHRCVLE